jgi:uncharacterized protein YjbJ (UPF0337 family)
MKSVKSVAVIALLSLFSLTACGEAQKAADTAADTAKGAADTAKDTAGKAADTAKNAAGKATDTAKDAAGKATDTAQGAADKTKTAMTDAAGKVQNVAAGLMAIKSDVMGLKDGTGQTLTAVKAGDFAKAQTEFGKVQTAWGKVSDTVKAQSADNHKTIETEMANVGTLLKEQKPDAAKVTTGLESLTKAFGGLIK